MLALAGGVLVLIIIIIVLIITKKKKLPIAPIAMVVFSICLLSPYAVEAKSVQWNSTINSTFSYFANYSDGKTGDISLTDWFDALKNPNVTIKYNAEIRDFATNALIGDNTSVSVGSKISLKFYKHEYADIDWFGTGYTTDSPYGEWRVDMAPPPVSCLVKDFVNKITEWDYDIYIPLVVAPPTKNITGLDNLTCEALTGNENIGYSMNCTVTGTGIINPQFNFGATTGHFYYRFYDPVDVHKVFYSSFKNALFGCNGNNIPLKVGDKTYILQVPAQTISYNLTATSIPAGNTPPNAPTVSDLSDTPPSYSFNINAIDPDGDQVKYGIDWDHDEKVDEWLPAYGLVNSGTDKQTSRTFNTSMTFQAIAQDQYGQLSPWTQHGITGLFTVFCSAPSVTISTNVVFTASSFNNLGNVTYSWNDRSTATTKTITGGYPTLGGHPDSTLGESPITVTGNDAQTGKTSKAYCSMNVIDPNAPAPVVDTSGDKVTCDALDGIVMASGTSQTFFKSRIAQQCEGQKIECVRGHLNEATTTYKYRSCVTPSPSEF
jgi:hypothetical protein